MNASHWRPHATASFFVPALVLALSGSAACDEATGTGTATPAPAVGPEAPAPGDLAVFEPGGETRCSRDTDFRFYAVGGNPTRVVIDFQGGGACWSAVTCSVADAIFQAEAPTEEQVRSWAGQETGIYALADPANPLHGWTLVHVPYCTGDIHWGDAVHEYSSSLVIHHRGYANATAALDWVYANYPDAERILVTGCSAGAYGAIGHASRIAEHYPDARVAVLADSGAGVITDTFFAESFPNWNAAANLPTHLPKLAGREVTELSIVDLYVGVADAFPDMRVAQYNTAYDGDQAFYYSAMGGDRAEWPGRMLDHVDAIAEAAPNFRSYVAPGPIHCINPWDLFYSRETGDEAYTDWLAAFVDGETAPDSARCEAEACLESPACDACAAGSDAPYCRWCADWPPE